MQIFTGKFFNQKRKIAFKENIQSKAIIDT